MITRQDLTLPRERAEAELLEIRAPLTGESDRVLNPSAIRFISRLCAEFEPRRADILRRRRQRQERLDAGTLPDFLPETREIRESDWTAAPIVPDLSNRRVEITGPVDRKMIINALNSGANVFMADFEDSTSPTSENLISGQANLMDAVRRTITYASPEGKTYRLNDATATLMVRPRGWHLNEKHALLSGQPVSASLLDFGLYFFHNARALLGRGSGPYFYLPKMEGHLEARLWNDVFVWAQRELGIPQGSIRATVLIETLPAAFEMDEILYELREHSAGLNCGRWDYIFSLIKKLNQHPRFVLSDRGLVTMTCPFMRNYSLLAIKTCHRRGIHCIGGMAAQIPIRDNPSANELALNKVREDKSREVQDGHDGTWVAHPGLVPIAMEQFSRMSGDHQICRKRCDVHVQAAGLLAVSELPRISEQGIRTNVSVGIQYLESWLRGKGCVPLYNLMEDAATAEISRAQLWQWVHHGAAMVDGRQVTRDLVGFVMRTEMAKLKAILGEEQFASGRFAEAQALFEGMIDSPVFPEFLTTLAYEQL